MIWIATKFCFIHCPRTAGLSITTALGSRIDHTNTDNVCLLNTAGFPPALGRHASAAQLVRQIPDWQHIFKWAVLRNP